MAERETATKDKKTGRSLKMSTNLGDWKPGRPPAAHQRENVAAEKHFDDADAATGEICANRRFPHRR